ncbi:MAG: hypothetical protein G8345_04845 [Magnetococcales bacterium]|nr:hypothetical protein [Magnetococcales bacterium]NGZ26198.1 hypothetical protein [Magnetococcales bacterium]
MSAMPRRLVTPNRPLHAPVPAGMTRVEFFNSPCNLRNLAEENGLLRTPEGFLLYRKLLGHSLEFDTSIILDTSQTILNPLGRPVRRDQLNEAQKVEWSRMTSTLLQWMDHRYPDPCAHLILCGEASLDATWPLSKPGVPSIRMIHNHFMVFDKLELAAAPAANPQDANLTDSGHHSLFLQDLSQVYLKFFSQLDLKLLRPISTETTRLAITGYPQGLPSWQVTGGMDTLMTPAFWREYDLVLQGFLDFYRAFFNRVSSRGAPIPKEAYFPEAIQNILYFDNDFCHGAKVIREKVLADPEVANRIRWQPAYKQLLYRDDEGRWVVTISQNSVGNAITELLGIVVERVEDGEAYSRAEPALLAKLMEVRDLLVRADLGEALDTPTWSSAPGGKRGKE